MSKTKNYHLNVKNSQKELSMFQNSYRNKTGTWDS